MTFDIFDLEFNLSPGHIVGIVLEISQRDFDDTSFDEFSGNSGTSGFGNAGFTEGFRVKRCGSLEIEPVLSAHGVDNFLLISLLSLFFAFSDGHAVRFIEKLFY